MTANTEQERAEFDAWAEEYGLSAEPNYNQHTRADCWAAWKAARRAQVVQSVAGIEGGVIRGEPTFAKPTAPPAAPQPPDAAPAQMPTPDGYIMDSLPNGRLEYKRGPLSQMDSICNSTMPVYEYGTVRQLIAAHGVK